MKSPKIKGVGEVVTEYGAKVMKVIKRGLLGRSLFDFYGDVKTNALRVKESSSNPLTPNDKDGGVVYVKNSDGKLYYKSNEVAEVELSSDIDTAIANIQPLYIKILSSDFMPDDSGKPIMINDASSNRFLESSSTNPMFATVHIPLGFKATHVLIYSNGTSAMIVSEANVNSRTVTGKGVGSVGTTLSIIDVTATSTNYIFIEVAQVSGEQVYGGVMTIAAV